MKEKLLLLLISVLTASVVCHAQHTSDSTVFTGKIRTFSGKPLQGVNVSLLRKRKLLAVCTTDSNGIYRLTTAPTRKTLTIRLKRKDYYRYNMLVYPPTPGFEWPMNFDMMSTAFTMIWRACPRPFDLNGHTIYDGSQYRRLAH